MNKTANSRPFFGEFGESIAFAMPEECVPNNPQVIWKPKDGEEYASSTEIQERYFLNLYLGWLFLRVPGHLKCPLRITRAGGEKQPDLLVTELDNEYGLEIAHATTWRYQRVSDEGVKSEGGGFIESDAGLNVEHDEEEFNPKASMLPFGTPLRCPGWNGMDPERQWAALVLNRILKKQCKLVSSYSKFRPNCELLLHYSSHLPPLCFLDFAISELKQRYLATKTESTSLSFRQISVVCKDWLIIDALGNDTKILRR